MKKFIKLIPALAMLLIATTLVSTATFAWFSMNNQVTVTGMEVKATVSDSLLIASSTEGTTKSEDSAFTKGINQSVYGVLQPVSTISGAKNSFYYTYDAKADGSKALALAQEPYVAVPTTGEDAYKVNDGTATKKDAFKDYVFEIKAINANSTGAKNLILSKLNLLYDGAAVTEHAYRVAIFTQEEATGAYAELATTTAADAIYAPASFAYFDSTAVKGTAEKAAVSPTVNNATTWAKSVPAQTTKYYKITVRLWLEGEDTDCFTSKFVTLTDEWTLDLMFELKAAGAGDSVTAIGSTAVLALTGTGNTRTAPAADAITGETIVSYQWYKDNLNQLLDTAATGTSNAAQYTATEAGSYYCVVTTAKGTKYRTDSFTYVTPEP